MNPLSIECDVHFTKHGRGRKELEAGTAPPAPTPAAPVPDERGNVEAAAYIAVAIDNFGAQESNALIYPGSAAGAKSSYVEGIHFGLPARRQCNRRPAL